jgi:hypothetical protein
MVIPGKPNLEIRIYNEHDAFHLAKFCHACEILGLENNKNFYNLKLEKMVMPHGVYFVGIDHHANKIWNIAGIHHLPEVGDNVWRCLFRGAQLPKYALGVSKDFLKVSYHWRYFLPLQIEYIKTLYPDSEFVVSTNIENNTAGKSDRLNKVIMPLLESQGLISFRKRTQLFDTDQNVWSVNVDFLTTRLHSLDD